MVQLSMDIRKIVGHSKQESVLERAFRMHRMMLELHKGKYEQSHENVRRFVGRVR